VGIRILDEGGNAADARITVAADIAVLAPMTAISTVSFFQKLRLSGTSSG
jgi:hypothetical protein